MVMSVVRGRMAELLAAQAGIENRPTDVFFLGVFSMIDALLGRPMEEVLDRLPLAAEVRAALLGEPNELGHLLDLILAYERGEWDAVSVAASKLAVEESDIPAFYFQAIAWAREYLPPMERKKSTLTIRSANGQGAPRRAEPCRSV
jgi:EAL and modified HD-GYP domain-containing signal transduction protein